MICIPYLLNTRGVFGFFLFAPHIHSTKKFPMFQYPQRAFSIENILDAFEKIFVR